MVPPVQQVVQVGGVKCILKDQFLQNDNQALILTSPSFRGGFGFGGANLFSPAVSSP